MLSNLKTYTFILFTFLSSHVFSNNKEDSTRYFLTAKIHYGFVMPHHSFIEYLLANHLSSVEITYSSICKDSIYYKPEKGIGLFVTSLGNNKIFGNSVSLFSFYNYNIFHTRDDRLRSDFRIGLGLGYVSKIFDLYKNNTDLVISAHVNAFINLGVEFKYRITPGCNINFGVHLSHLSNGKMKAPNNGINLVTANAGIAYALNQKPERIRHNIRPITKSWMYEAIVAGGMTVIAVHIPGKFFISTANINAFRQYHPKFRVGIGADFFYNQSVYTSLETGNLYDWEGHKDYKKSDNISLGIHLAHEFCHNRLTYTIQMGSYLKSAMYGPGGLYHRIGIKYSVTDRLMLNLTLKTHWGIAEYIEWGLGYRLTRK
jgi:hypothetical protein